MYAFLRQENMHLLHGSASQLHQLGFPRTCLS
ncbi:hypothetical protein Golax_021435, partial [Gossypium laxum]|nr:hypothetical protein [Gossypium laxum]